MKVCFFILLFFPGLYLNGQVVHYTVQREDLAIQIFYQKTGSRIAWISAAGKQHFDMLTAYLRKAAFLGLKASDYDPVLIQALADSSYKMPTATDTLNADVRITEAAIHFFRDVAYGRLAAPPVKYNGLPPLPNAEAAIAAKLADSLSMGRFSNFLPSIEPPDTAYILLKNSIAALYPIIMDTAFKEISVKSLKADSSNVPLLLRLRQIGIVDTLAGIGQKPLSGKIKEAQHLFNTLDDGVLRDRFLKALNVPLMHRLQDLYKGLNEIRWLHYYKMQASVVLVNIPSTTLVLYEHGKPVLYSRVITGKKSTPTPTLGSCITEVILFPYWTVPNKIAVGELLPHIKRDRQYLADNQFVILDKRGRIVNPSDINWNNLSRSNFPYTIRQNTGCDNSLGIVKLNFYSPFGIYLHDTPGKNLFMLQQRFFSHGCVRVEEAVQLAHMLLDKEAAAMMALEAKGSQPDQHPVIFPVPATTYVLILYNTAWPDATGQVRFYEDVYGKN
ncbi:MULTISPECIES: L,D-transpeptidase family protein [Chitinophaga]|uniref:L,D-transpeptidase family protein n=1 Tax=Chitinophaga TaxID=79328 RepID=UPI001FFCF048|nr:MULTISPECIES: L,D-transpeptidase family protein [Chitinophaga]